MRREARPQVETELPAQLASHILSRVNAALSRDWELIYGHPIWFAETFIDPDRFRVTCYRAANWLLGRTTGRGKEDLMYRQNRAIKEVDAKLQRVIEPVKAMKRSRRRVDLVPNSFPPRRF